MPSVLPLVGTRLVGPHLVLDALTEADAAELGSILMAPEVYAHGYVMHHRPTSVAEATEFALARFVHVARPTGDGHGRTPYAIRLAVDTDQLEAGRLVGTSSLGDFDTSREATHLGWTLLDPRVWSTYVNPEAKLLLLTHAFEDLGYGRVKIQTDALNTRSQAAIAKLGAVREGVARRDVRREDGTWRDTVVYSITIDDWPCVKRALKQRIA